MWYNRLLYQVPRSLKEGVEISIFAADFVRKSPWKRQPLIDVSLELKTELRKEWLFNLSL